jgi:hypothetical protein
MRIITLVVNLQHPLRSRPTLDRTGTVPKSASASIQAPPLHPPRRSATTSSPSASARRIWPAKKESEGVEETIRRKMGIHCLPRGWGICWSTLRGRVEGSRPRWPPPPPDYRCPRTELGLLVEVMERCRLNPELVTARANASNC